MAKVTFAKCYAQKEPIVAGPFPNQAAAVAHVLEHDAPLRWSFYYVIEDTEQVPKIQDFECLSCEAVTEAWDMPSKCAQCGHTELQKLLPVPALYGLEGSASFLQGTKRKGFAELKEANALEKASFDLPVEKRREIQSEIKKIKDKL